MKNFMPYAAALLNATIVGLSFLFTKLAINATSPIDTLGYRFLIAWIILHFFVKMFHKNHSAIKWDKKAILPLMVLALFYPTLFFSFQAFGLSNTSSAEGGIIMAFTPALTALLAAFFLKEKINRMQVFFVLLSIFGVVYITFMNGVSISFSTHQLIGVFFLLISTLSLAGYTVLARFLSVSYSPIQLTHIMVTFGMVFFNIYALTVKALQGQVLDYFTLVTHSEFLFSVLFLGIFATMLTAFLSNYILSKLTASKMSIFSNLSTVISILAGAVILKEEIHVYHIIGSIMIITGILGMNLSKDKVRVIHSRTL